MSQILSESSFRCTMSYSDWIMNQTIYISMENRLEKSVTSFTNSISKSSRERRAKFWILSIWHLNVKRTSLLFYILNIKIIHIWHGNVKIINIWHLNVKIVHIWHLNIKIIKKDQNVVGKGLFSYKLRRRNLK